MNTIPALHSGLQGVQRGLEQLDRHAAEIASAEQFNSESGAGSNLVNSLIGLKTSEIQVALSMKVLKSVEETIGTLLDIRA